MKREYRLEIRLQKIAADVIGTAKQKDVFKRSYKIALWDEFLQKQTENLKEQKFENYADGFISQLLLNGHRPYISELKKRSIYAVNFGVNVGSEINGRRPALIYARDEPII